MKEENEGEEGIEFDPEHFDVQGRALWYGELKVEMNPDSKQYEQLAEDLTDEIKAGWEEEPEVSSQGPPPLCRLLVPTLRHISSHNPLISTFQRISSPTKRRSYETSLRCRIWHAAITRGAHSPAPSS